MAAVSCTLACEPCADQPGGDLDVEGFELYNLHHQNTGESVRIYHDGQGTIALVHVDAEGRIEEAGQIRAMLTPGALAILDDLETQLASGAEIGAFNPECLGFVDSPVSRLSVQAANASLQFSYPLQCAPSLLVALDELCRGLIADLPTCSGSPHFDGCQQVE